MYEHLSPIIAIKRERKRRKNPIWFKPPKNYYPNTQQREKHTPKKKYAEVDEELLALCDFEK